MNDPVQQLSQRFSSAIEAAFGERGQGIDPLIRPAQNPKFGDYQANVAMSLGKSLAMAPRDAANAILKHLVVDDLCEAPTVAGPGFINLTIKNEVLSHWTEQRAEGDRLGMPPTGRPLTIVIDYSSPNVAKEMHVGHLRSTVIGDSLARTLDFIGHRVIRQNHLGDWGTQFGMLIEHLSTQSAAGAEIADLNRFYQQAKARFDTDPSFAERARARVVALQAGDTSTLQQWRNLVEQSKHHFNAAYARLDISLRDEHVRGESYYNDRLAAVVNELESKSLSQVSDGAVCVFVNGHDDPLMVRKSDGGYGYAATDLAALRYRFRELGAQRVIYVVDSRQSDHFHKVFAVAQAVGWITGDLRAEHVKFGTILGPDNKPFKTRTGDTVRLADLLDEAEQRATAIVKSKAPDLSEAETMRVAHMVGIGAVKYGDLCADRIKDYVFSWERMLAMEGNTAPYLQYAHARICSIFRKAGTESPDIGTIKIEHESERALAIKLLQFPAVVGSVADKLEPHHLCGWLFELATTFSAFYENCPVIKLEDPGTRASRLALCELTRRGLRIGLNLLGIEVPSRM